MAELPQFTSPGQALRAHWLLYLYEALELGAFMLSACLFTVLLFHPHFTAITHIHNPWFARALMGLAMGSTAILIIKSPGGQRSGAHFNPAISLTFYRLGKIGPYDTLFYVIAHFLGGIAGVGLSALLTPAYIAAPSVRYAVTVPGLGGEAGAFAAELFMSTLTMSAVLYTSGNKTLAPYTTWVMGLLISLYVLFLAPVSGFSQNPARTFASGLFPPLFTGLWIYFTAPLIGMFAAAETYLRLTTPHKPYLRHRHLIQR